MNESITLSGLGELIAEVWASHRDKDSPTYNACEKTECAWCEDTRLALAALSVPPVAPQEEDYPDQLCGNCGHCRSKHDAVIGCEEWPVADYSDEHCRCAVFVAPNQPSDPRPTGTPSGNEQEDKFDARTPEWKETAGNFSIGRMDAKSPAVTGEADPPPAPGAIHVYAHHLSPAPVAGETPWHGFLGALADETPLPASPVEWQFSADDFERAADLEQNYSFDTFGHVARLREAAALHREVARLTTNLTSVVKAEEAYRASEGAALHRLSDALTGGAAGQWGEIFHAAETAEREVARLTHELSESRKDWMYHSDCRPNRKQAEAAMADAKAMNDQWADEVKARRDAEAEVARLTQEARHLRSRLLYRRGGDGD